MAVPEVIDWADTLGFRYIKPRRAETRDDISIEAFVEALGDRPLDLETLKAKSIYRISASTEEVVDTWSAFRCLYSEIGLDDKLYLLNNGRWYEIAAGFTEQVNRHFEQMPRSDLVFPDCETNDEETYNKSVAEMLPDYTCLDRQIIMHGGGRGRVEFCDLITNDKQLIHVKRYGGSDLLSHLFNQGIVSGELFVGDSDFRQKANGLLPDGLKIADTRLPLKASDYEVVYAIISKSPRDLDMPFFSKVSLRNAYRRLSSYGYKVSIKKIQKVSTVATIG